VADGANSGAGRVHDAKACPQSATRRREVMGHGVRERCHIFC
jgi:hypothetical protein